MRDRSGSTGDLVFDARQALDRATEIWNAEHEAPSHRTFTWGSISSHFETAAEFQAQALLHRFISRLDDRSEPIDRFESRLNSADAAMDEGKRRDQAVFALEEFIRKDIEGLFRSHIETRWFLWLVSQEAGTKRTDRLRSLYRQYDERLVPLYERVLAVTGSQADPRDFAAAVTAVVEGAAMRSIVENRIYAQDLTELARILLMHS